MQVPARHLLFVTRHDGDLSRFKGWLTLTHTQRCHAHRGTGGTGHVYQGRFKSITVQADDHFLTACRYVERNALRGKQRRQTKGANKGQTKGQTKVSGTFSPLSATKHAGPILSPVNYGGDFNTVGTRIEEDDVVVSGPIGREDS